MGTLCATLMIPVADSSIESGGLRFLDPPNAVRTQPGSMETNTIFLLLASFAKHFVNIFNAALEVWYDVLENLEELEILPTSDEILITRGLFELFLNKGMKAWVKANTPVTLIFMTS